MGSVSVQSRSSSAQPHLRATPAQAILKNVGGDFAAWQKLVYGLSQSLDGYVDHMKLGRLHPRPSVTSSSWCVADGHDLRSPHVRDHALLDEDLPDWDAVDREFAMAWRKPAEVGRVAFLKSVGPNARYRGRLREGDPQPEGLSSQARFKLAGHSAHSLTEAGLIDEYRLYSAPSCLVVEAILRRPRPPLHWWPAI